MKINDQKINVELNNYLRGPGDKGAQHQVKDQAASSGDKVEISQRSKEVQKARDVVDGVPDVRDARVDELKKSINDGTYNASGEAVAAGIIKKSLIDGIL
ncbi:MAG: flagellar biosynthesis anti-sigma factor FlgM [Deltaproteobacteria bacterium]|nr:flagellar biosynthesis anti-sigma factor FlgM [Deltaproteobacteria bacterium]